MLLGEPGYAAAILNVHRHVHDIAPFRTEHFDRWYTLLIDSVDQRWTEPNAARAKTHVAQIAAVLGRQLLDIDWQPPSPPGPLGTSQVLIG